MASILETFYILFQTDAKRVTGELEAADAAAEKLAAGIDKAGKALPANQLQAGRRALDDAQRSAGRLDDELRDAARGADRIGDELDDANRELAQANRQAAALGASFGNLVGRAIALAGAFVGVREVVEYADEYKRLQGQIRLTTKTTEEFATATAGVFQIAQRTRQGLMGTTALYASLQRSTETLGYSQERLLGVTETINKAITISGTSASAAEAALVQLGQGFASGTLRGEELNSVLEQAPRLAKAIAEGMGVTVGELRKLGGEGKITADQVFRALEGQGAAIAAEFGQMGVTVGSAMTVLRNASVKFVGELDTALGASERFAVGITKLADAIGALFAWLQENRTLVQGFFIGLSAALGVVAAVLWGTYIPAWAAAAVAVLAATWPILAIIAAVGAAATAFALLWEDVQAFLNGQPSLLGDLVNKYEWVRKTVEFIGEAFKFLGRTVPPILRGLGDFAVMVFRQIWRVAGPIISLIIDQIKLIYNVTSTTLRFVWAVWQEVFGAIWPYLQPILQLVWQGIRFVGQIFGAVAKGIWGAWGALFDQFVARIQVVIGWVRQLMGFIETGRQALEKLTPGTPRNAPAVAAGVARGQTQLAAARASPLAAVTSQAVANRAVPVQKRTDVRVDKVEVHTQATDAEGISRAVGGALTSELRRTTAHFDDGVER